MTKILTVDRKKREIGGNFKQDAQNADATLPKGRKGNEEVAETRTVAKAVQRRNIDSGLAA